MDQNTEDDEGITSKSDAEEKEEKRSWLWYLLDKLEDVEIRMIYGIFRFIFIRVPCFIRDIILEWFPTLLKFLKVTVLFLIWCLIILSPIVLFSYNSYEKKIHHGSDYTSSFQDILYFIINLEFLKTSSQFSENYMIWIWSILGVMGSVWGILYIRRKKIGLLTRMKKTFRRHV